MLGTETVTVAGDLVRDDDNNMVPAPGLGKVDGCCVFPLSTSELIERGRSGTADVIRVTLPITEGIDSTSILVLSDRAGDLRYQVDGNPAPYINPDDPELSGYDITATRRVG